MVAPHEFLQRSEDGSCFKERESLAIRTRWRDLSGRCWLVGMGGYYSTGPTSSSSKKGYVPACRYFDKMRVSSPRAPHTHQVGSREASKPSGGEGLTRQAQGARVGCADPRWRLARRRCQGAVREGGREEGITSLQAERPPPWSSQSRDESSGGIRRAGPTLSLLSSRSGPQVLRGAWIEIDHLASSEVSILRGPNHYIVSG